tara:strand:+ start:12 stop:584 length:573 start_codon:yes stop_codon:yes gene_type:complete
MSQPPKQNLPQLIILDRDGVINEDSDQYIKSPEEWQAIPGSLEAIGLLTQQNIPVTVATNQSGIARGYFDLSTLTAMHQKMLKGIETHQGKIQHIALCPHGPDEDCVCRKPKIGMLEEISQALSIPLSKKVYFIGDSYKDIQAARKAGCTPILVKTGKGKQTFKAHSELENNIKIYDNLRDFTKTLLDLK